MKKVVALVALVVALGWSGSAQAQTTFSPESVEGPWERWVARAEVPTPRVELTLHPGPCGLEAVAHSCTQRGLTEVWISLDRHKKSRFWHELGHQFDYVEIDHRERRGLMARMERRGRWIQRDKGLRSPHELFAEGYSQCEMGLRDEASVIAYWRFKRVCRYLEKAD